MADKDSRDLTRAEESYAAQVRYQLRHLPSQQQTALMQSVRRALLGGTPMDGYPRLERELGTPAQYADRLLGRGGDSEEPASPAKRAGLFGRRK